MGQMTSKDWDNVGCTFGTSILVSLLVFVLFMAGHLVGIHNPDEGNLEWRVRTEKHCNRHWLSGVPADEGAAAMDAWRSGAKERWVCTETALIRVKFEGVEKMEYVPPITCRGCGRWWQLALGLLALSALIAGWRAHELSARRARSDLQAGSQKE